MQDVEEVQRIKKLAQDTHDKATKEKNATQKIRLILNVIAPDNYAKKFGELRSFLFPNLKTRGECKE